MGAESVRRLRQQRAASGLCVRCGKHPPRANQQWCEICQTRESRKHRRWLKETAKKRLAAGLCKACGRYKLAAISSSRCRRCLKNEADNAFLRNQSDAVKQHNRDTMRAWYQRLRLQVIDHYTNGTRKCMCCGYSGAEFLTIDHVGNDGNDHRHNSGIKPGVKLFKYIINNNYPSTFQILCWNCNCAKAYYGNGVCPHKLKKELRIGDEIRQRKKYMR